ncbi:MAG TPA: hypothetical protein VIF62_37525 [Labilithrix sp.]|jgi:hypothetical protein
MKTRFLAVIAIAAAAAACGGGSSDDAQQAAPVPAMPPGHVTTEDTSPKEGPRLMPAETYIRSYLEIFGGLAPLPAQAALQAHDGTTLFDTWDDYLGTLGMPDYRYDTPRTGQTNTLMVATFERVGIALCDRALEHDRSTSPRLVFDFDIPATIDAAGFAQRFDVVHRTFLGYPAALAPTPRTARYFKLYTDTIALHASVSGSRFSPAEAGWAAVCYGLVRHPEFHLY